MKPETKNTASTSEDLSESTGMNRLFDDYKKFSTNTIHSIMDSQIKFMNTCIDCSNDQWNRLVDSKSPEDFFNGETELVFNYLKRLYDDSQKLIDASTQAQEAMLSLWRIDNFMLSTSKPESKALAKRQS